MKTKQLLATLLALVFMVSALPLAASAYYRESVRVSVDGNIISDVDAYLDDNGDVRVSNVDDLLKIFPREIEEGDPIAYDPDDGILVKHYAYEFGYSFGIRREYTGTYHDYTFYITTGWNNNNSNNNGNNNSNDSILGSGLPNNGYTNGYEYPEVYINGIYTPMSSFWEYARLDFSQYTSQIFSGNRVYLNNDGNSPVEVLVNGTLIHFPDQQPIVVKPGRTMVPIRTIAEMVKCKVEWNSQLKCAEISQGKNFMRIYPGNTVYQFNGRNYQMDVEPFVLNGRTMVPLRFIAEAFGWTVDHYTENLLTVTLTSKSKT